MTTTIEDRLVWRAVAVTTALLTLGACDGLKTSALATCGNGKVESGEACDDGNRVGGDYCAADCSRVTAVCGDGVVQVGEACDDGNGILTDGCLDTPTAGCVLARCGDGVVHEGVESCDSAAVAGGDCSSCAVSCHVGFANCNGSLGDGCEVNIYNDASNCGACDHACDEGWECTSGYCIHLLAVDQGRPTSIVADDIAVYWTTFGTSDALGNYNYDGTVSQFDLATGETLVLAAAQHAPTTIVLDGANVYWGVGLGSEAGSTGIWRVRVGGGLAAQVAPTSGEVVALTINEDYAYWLDIDGNLVAASTTNGGSPTTLASAIVGGSFVGVAGGNIYYDDYAGFSTYGLQRISVAGGPAEAVPGASGIPSSFLATAANIFLLAGDVGDYAVQLEQLAIAGGTWTRLAGLHDWALPCGLSQSDAQILWAACSNSYSEVSLYATDVATKTTALQARLAIPNVRSLAANSDSAFLAAGSLLGAADGRIFQLRLHP